MNYTKIKFLMFEKVLNVITYSVSFSQSGNTQKGGATGTVKGNQIAIEIESDGQNNFVGWMIDETGEQKGSIEFHNGENIVKTIEFSGAVLIGYSQQSKEIVEYMPHPTEDYEEVIERRHVLAESLKINYKLITFGGEPEVEFTKAEV